MKCRQGEILSNVIGSGSRVGTGHPRNERFDYCPWIPSDSLVWVRVIVLRDLIVEDEGGEEVSSMGILIPNP